MGRANYWWPFQKARMSRRALLKAAGIATAGAASTAGVACGGEGEKGVPATRTALPQGTPQPGGDMKIGLLATPCGLDAMLCTTLFWISGQFYSYLIDLNVETQTVDLEMAEEYEHPDDLTFVFKLRPGIKFHNVDPVYGREVTTDDIVYSFERHRDDPNVTNDKTFLKTITERFEAVDKYTFRLVTKQPYSPALNEVSSPTQPIVPHEAVEKFGNLQEHAVGAGPYIPEGFVREERCKMRRNPEYFKPGKPYLNSREWVIIPDLSTLYQAFRTKQTDYNYAAYDNVKIDELQRTDHVVIGDAPNLWYRTLLLRVDKPPFNDVRVREAVDLSLDRQAMIDRLAFGEGKFCGPISPDLEYWTLPQDEVRDFYRVDYEKAKQLLAAAGYPDGLKLDMIVERTSNIPEEATVVQDVLRKGGIDANLVIREEGIWLSQHLLAGNFLMNFFLNLPFAEPDKPLGNWYSKGMIGFNFCGYSNPQFDELMEKQRREFDPQERRQIVFEAQRLAMKEHVALNTYTPRNWSVYWDWVHPLLKGQAALSTRGFLADEVWMSPRV